MFLLLSNLKKPMPQFVLYNNNIENSFEKTDKIDVEYGIRDTGYVIVYVVNKIDIGIIHS